MIPHASAMTQESRVDSKSTLESRLSSAQRPHVIVTRRALAPFTFACTWASFPASCVSTITSISTNVFFTTVHYSLLL